MIFGQLGNDTIQGDGDDRRDRGRRRASRTPRRRVATRSARSTLVGSFEAATDGDDYIEGGGGDDVIFGGLGQDDLIGGSSTCSRSTTPRAAARRRRLIFGGAGTRIDRNATDPALADATRRDADAIVGDNGNIFRIVGTDGADGGAASRFDYDNDATARSIVVRGVELLDYTPGGPDFRPDLLRRGAGRRLRRATSAAPTRSTASPATTPSTAAAATTRCTATPRTTT